MSNSDTTPKHLQSNKIFSLKVKGRTAYGRPVDAEKVFNELGYSNGFIHLADILKERKIAFSGYRYFDNNAREPRFAKVAELCFKALRTKNRKVLSSLACSFSNNKKVEKKLKTLVNSLKAEDLSIYNKSFQQEVQRIISATEELQAMASKEAPEGVNEQVELGKNMVLLADSIHYGYESPENLKEGSKLDKALDSCIDFVYHNYLELKEIHALVQDIKEILNNSKISSKIESAYLHINGELYFYFTDKDGRVPANLRKFMLELASKNNDKLPLF